MTTEEITKTILSDRVAAQLHSIGVKRPIKRCTPLGIDTSRFAPLMQKEKGTILFVGRLVPEKSPLILVETLRILRERGISVKLIMVGDGALKAQIEKTATSLQLNELLTLKGDVPYSEVQRFYEKSEIFVLPSQREGLSSALLEAMSSGCVCIASDIRDNLAVIRHMFNGLIFHVNDAKDLADQICSVLSLPDTEVAKLTSHARKTVERAYSVQVVAEALREVFTELE